MLLDFGISTDNFQSPCPRLWVYGRRLRCCGGVKCWQPKPATRFVAGDHRLIPDADGADPRTCGQIDGLEVPDALRSSARLSGRQRSRRIYARALA